MAWSKSISRSRNIPLKRKDAAPSVGHLGYYFEIVNSAGETLLAGRSQKKVTLEERENTRENSTKKQSQHAIMMTLLANTNKL